MKQPATHERWTLVRASGGWWHVAEVLREGKRFAWVRYSGIGEVRETRRATNWRFASKEAAEAERSGMVRALTKYRP